MFLIVSTLDTTAVAWIRMHVKYALKYLFNLVIAAVSHSRYPPDFNPECKLTTTCSSHSAEGIISVEFTYHEMPVEQ